MTTKRKTKPKKRTGAPARSSVVGESTLISPKGTKYTIIHTTEVDEYEERPKKRKK